MMKQSRCGEHLANWSARLAAVACGAIVGVAGLNPARADDDFYKGKTITLTIGVEVGGGYDQYARVLARHMSKHIPGEPAIVPQNLPGAGSLKAAQRLYKIAPKDGTEFGTVYRSIPIMPLLGQASEYDASKFSWIGSMNSETAVCVSWHTSPIKTFADTFKQELVVGTVGKGADLSSFEEPLINLLGAKLKVIRGYHGGSGADLAMERGEINGRCGVSWSTLLTLHPSWLEQKKLNILVQLGHDPVPQLSGVPMVQTFAKSPDDKEVLDLLLSPQVIGRPFLAPPGVPKERLNMLREAFSETLKDPEFLADAKKQHMEVHLVRGDEVEALIQKTYASPKRIIDRARFAVQ